MPSYHIQYVDNHGPYLRKSWYEGDEQQWEHIGPLHAISPDELPEHVTAEIREEGYGLARYRDTVEADVRARYLANSLRDELIDEYGEDVLAPEDDRRETVIRLDEEAPPDAGEYIAGQAAEIQSEERTIGQAPLKDSELDEIDWSRPNANVPHAQASKAALLDAGVSNWMDYYDPESHPDPQSHAREIEKGKQQTAQTGAPSAGDKRLDNEGDGLESIDVSGAFDRASSYEQDLMEDAADAYADGDDEAGEFLQDEFDIGADALTTIEAEGSDAIPA